jgi:hypothetical protein
MGSMQVVTREQNGKVREGGANTGGGCWYVPSCEQQPALEAAVGWLSFNTMCPSACLGGLLVPVCINKVQLEARDANPEVSSLML